MAEPAQCRDDSRAHLALKGKNFLAFELARANGYLVAGGHQHHLAKLWLRWCWSQAWPYLRVRPRSKASSLFLDTQPCGAILSAEAAQRLRAVIGGYSLLPRCEWYGHFSCRVSQLPLGMAEQLAADIVALLRAELGLVTSG